MQAQTIKQIHGDVAPAAPATSRFINPVTGYALAVVVSGAFWAMLLAVIF